MISIANLMPSKLELAIDLICSKVWGATTLLSSLLEGWNLGFRRVNNQVVFSGDDWANDEPFLTAGGEDVPDGRALRFF